MKARLSSICLALAVAVSLSTAASGLGANDDKGRLAIRVVSNTRPDRVSGGDVLVEIANGTGASVTLNGEDVSAMFHSGTKPNSLLGLVTGLTNGKNMIAVADKTGQETLVVTNYPITGPISSGPRLSPFICDTHRFKLPDNITFTGNAITDDPTCSALTNINYVYMPAGGKELVPLPSTNALPANIATTTTSTGVTVKFIVRVETSTIDRGIYQSAILHDPTVDPEPTPFAPPKGWNRKLLAVEGFGCNGGWYRQGQTIGNITTDGMPFILLQIARLGEGWAMFSNTLQHPSNNCNSVLSGEAAYMSKEHFIETYGEPKVTVSAGASGGSYGSFMLADQFPGLFDGVLVARTFADPLALALSGMDARLLVDYFSSQRGVGLSVEQKNAISGYKGIIAMADAARESGRADPFPNRRVPGLQRYNSASHSVVPPAQRYDPKTNPTGVRASVFDAARNVFGVDEHGYAYRVFDNVGVQYGLRAFTSGAITAAQFLDLNEYIGGLDHDSNNIPARTAADAGALRRAYQSGLHFSGAGGLTSIPIVNLTGMYNEDGCGEAAAPGCLGYHYVWFHFAVRERLVRSNGDASNYVSWRGRTDMVPFEPSWKMFMTWVEAAKHDNGPGTPRQKVARNRPESAVDGCWTSPTQFIKEPQTLSRTPNTPCNALVPAWTFPKYVAGGPLAADILKCQLKPVNRKDYPVSMTEEEFARLKKIFADGVCDWSKRGVSQATVVPWASFGPAPENLIFDLSAK